MPAIIATHRSELERYYTCPRCGARGEVKLAAVGRSVWGVWSVLRLVLSLVRMRRVNDIGTGTNAQDEAESTAQRDADRILALMRCPSCGKRPRMAFVGPILRVAGYAIVGAVVSVLLFMFHIMIAPLLGAGIFAAIGAIGEIGRFERVRRATALKMETTRGALPEARAVIVAPKSEQASTGDEPSLLR